MLTDLSDKNNNFNEMSNFFNKSNSINKFDLK